MSNWQSKSLSIGKSRPHNNWEWFSSCVNDIYKFEKRWADVFQIYPNAIHFNPLQFCPSMSLLGFPVFCLRSSIVLSRFCDILINSMTIWSVLKLPKIAWPGPFDHFSNINNGKLNITGLSGRINGVAALTGFPYRKMYGYFARTKNFAVIARWP